RRRRGETLIGLASGERLPGHRPEQPIHLTLVIAHLLQLGLHVRAHPVRRLSTLTHIDRSIVGIILGRRIVTPRRIPVAVVPVVITATDQFHAVVTRPIPTLIVPFRMIRAEYVVLRTLPLIASLNPIVLIVRDRRNLLRLWLRAEVRVLRLDLLHLLRIGLGLLPARYISRRVLLAGCRNRWSCACRCCRRSSTHCTRGRCRSSGCFRSTSLHPFPRLLRAGRGTGGRLTGNICSRLGAGRRFLARFALSALSCAALG